MYGWLSGQFRPDNHPYTKYNHIQYPRTHLSIFLAVLKFKKIKFFSVIHFFYINKNKPNNMPLASKDVHINDATAKNFVVGGVWCVCVKQI